MASTHSKPSWEPAVLTSAHVQSPLQVAEFCKSKVAVLNETAMGGLEQVKAALTAPERATLGGPYA
jgi:hypothetical protein